MKLWNTEPFLDYRQPRNWDLVIDCMHPNVIFTGDKVNLQDLVNEKNEL